MSYKHTWHTPKNSFLASQFVDGIWPPCTHLWSVLIGSLRSRTNPWGAGLLLIGLQAQTCGSLQPRHVTVRQTETWLDHAVPPCSPPIFPQSWCTFVKVSWKKGLLSPKGFMEKRVTPRSYPFKHPSKNVARNLSAPGLLIGTCGMCLLFAGEKIMMLRYSHVASTLWAWEPWSKLQLPDD